MFETATSSVGPTPTLDEMMRDWNAALAGMLSIPPGKLRENPRSSYDEGMYKMRAAAMRVFYTPHALEQTAERLFPESKNRSRRIHKKLVKRFGGEYRMVPTIWQTPVGIFAHPSFKARLEAALSK